MISGLQVEFNERIQREGIAYSPEGKVSFKYNNEKLVLARPIISDYITGELYKDFKPAQALEDLKK